MTGGSRAEAKGKKRLLSITFGRFLEQISRKKNSREFKKRLFGKNFYEKAVIIKQFLICFDQNII